jgi:bisphosphoglycerate-dependent phosphoglycerate mutase
VALTQRGIVEAVEAGQVFASHGLTFRKCYTSLLTRSIVTAQRALEAAGVAYTPIEYDWRINERHYGYVLPRSNFCLSFFGIDLIFYFPPREELYRV